jgi:hypothetical protein
MAMSLSSDAVRKLQRNQSLDKSGRGQLLYILASGEMLMSSDADVLRNKLLQPPNERQRQETVDLLNIVNTAQEDPYYNNIVHLVSPLSPFTLCKVSPTFVSLPSFMKVSHRVYLHVIS